MTRPSRNVLLLKRLPATLAWCLYDVGNSAFATTIMAVLLPIYFRLHIAPNLPGSLPTVYWGYASSTALLLSAILAPLVGTMADLRGWKKIMLGTFALLGIISSALLYLPREGDWIAVLILLITGTIGFSASIVVYDSLLPHVAPPGRTSLVSARGYALGYLGGGTLLAINITMIYLLPGKLGYRLSFLSVAIWWGIFTIPLMFRIQEPPLSENGIGDKGPLLEKSLRRLLKTFRELKKYREAFKFLAAFWLYNDGIGTIMRMAAIFGAQIGIGTMHLVCSLLLTQFIGVPFSILFGRLAMRLGGKRTISLGLICYSLIAAGAVLMTSNWHFWLLAAAVGTVQGGTQAISRSVYASMLPHRRSAEFFGFYDVSSKFAGIAGPAMFGLIIHLTGSIRLGAILLVSMFLGGLWALSTVDVKAGMADAGNI